MPDIIRVGLVLTRTTKRTHRFDADKEGQAVTTLYVQQTAFPAGPPDAIVVTVEAVTRTVESVE